MPSYTIEKRKGTDNLLATMELPFKMRGLSAEDRARYGLPARRFARTTGTPDPKMANSLGRAFAVEWQAKINSAMSEAKATFWNRKLVEIFGTKEGAAMRDAPTLLTVPLADGRNTTVNYETGQPVTDSAQQAPDDSVDVVTFGDGKSVRLRGGAASGSSFGGTKFAKFADEWIASRVQAERLKAKQAAMYRSDILAFAKSFPYVESVTLESVKQWTLDLQAGETTVKTTVKTINRKLAALRGYWRHLRSRNKVEKGLFPFDGRDLDLPKVKKGANKHKQFTPEEVLALLRAARTGYTQTVRDRKELKTPVKHGPDLELADVIEVARWTGMRRQSICALQIQNIRIGGKVPFLHIEKDKSDAGERDVPIHPSLAPVLRRLIGKRKEGFLFADLGDYAYGDRSNGVGNKFGDMKTALGHGPKHTLHSIRATVMQQLLDPPANVPLHVVQAIVGHEPGSVTLVHYADVKLPQMYAAIKKLNYGKEGKAK